MKKQIAVVHLTSSLKMGGAEAVLCDLITHLPQDKFRHTVIYFHEGPNLERLHALQIPTIQVQGLFFRYDPIFFIRLYRILKQLNPDCIHALLWAANICGRIIGRLLGIACVNVFHNNVDQDGLLRNWLDRATLLFADRLVAISSGIVQSIKDRDGVLPVKKIEVIPNGVDRTQLRIKEVQYQTNRYEFGFTEDHLIIGTVGRLVSVKRYELLLESFALVNTVMPLARLMIVGSGPQESILKNKAIALGIEQSVVFVVEQQAYGYYPLFDCFVQSSDKEGISIALLEALSFGLPCIVTNADKSHPVIQSGRNGLIVPAGNMRGLANGIMTILNDPASAQAMGNAGQQTIQQHFTLQQMVSAYEKLFRQLSEDKKSSL
ncbi:MAG TPA: glycosyltransferase [Candidatus Babeliales bacterium]|nr:glycosyltransferase [Candidatus Babeliales bacterium]